MTVRPHPTKPNAWQIDCYPDGRKGPRVRLCFTGTRQKALEAEAAILDKSLDDEIQHWKIKDAVPDFLEWIKVHRSLVTHNDMKRSFKSRIIPHFGEYQVRMLTPEVFDRFHAWVGKPKMVNNCQDYLKSLISWMVKRRIATALSFKIDKMIYHRPLHVAPHPSEIEKFIEALRGYRKIMALMILISGARWNEVANLRWENCNLDEGFAKLNESNTERDRYIILHGECLEWLKENQKPSGLCFPSPITGKAQKSITKAFQLAKDRSGVSLRTHLLRYAAGQHIYEATGDIYLTQNFMGHASVETTTRIYVKNRVHRLREGVNAAVDYVDKKRGEKDDQKQIVIK